jgi:hypothetical protein
MCGATPSLPQYVFMTWCLVKQRDNFTFYTEKSEMDEMQRTEGKMKNEYKILMGKA